MSKVVEKMKGVAAGQFSGKFRTPLVIFSAFFVIGIVLDVVFEWLICNIFKGRTDVFNTRINVGFRFWFLLPSPEEGGWWYYPDSNKPEEKIDARQTIAIDDLILLIVTFGILLIWKMKIINRIAASMGFFAGWYVSSMWLSSHIQQRLPHIEASTSNPNPNPSRNPNSKPYGGMI